MKHIALKLSIFSMILLSTFLWSCKEEPPFNDGSSNISVINSTTITYNDYLTAVNDVGIHHNECLDTIYNKLWRIKNEIDPHPQDSINDFIYNEVLNFAEDENYDLSYIISMEFNTFPTISEYLNTAPNISIESFNMLNELDSIFNEYALENITLTQFNQFCEVKINSAFYLDSITERYIVGATYSIAKSSANFWNENLNDWIELGVLEESIINRIDKNNLNNVNFKVKNDDRLLLSPMAKKVIASDIQGAVKALSTFAGYGGRLVLWAGGPQGAAAVVLGGTLVSAGVSSAARGVLEAGGGLPWYLDWVI